MKLFVAKLGEIDYQDALTMQEKLLLLRQQNKVEDIMLLLQHPPTLTLGTRENRYNILVPEVELKRQGVNIFKSNRGGDVTYHGPGQIVGYPIVDLNGHGKSIREYVHKIEETFIQLLKEEYDLTASRESKYHGVWLGNEKITAIGCAVKRWVTMHGFAFNVNTNLSHFNLINPCGITDRGVTSLQKIFGQPQDMEKVYKQVITYFSRVFDFEPEIIDDKKLNEIVGRE
ncbi:lipoate-protein ligase B [Desulforamulus reducens MI-1]|uniref:Octanoyltransferase n=1 Tax=Desulforamulus reducens (strain ATCC BAA-1160 / DSM 100696 / MI-1) TaxID=349161 RepID=LIPB_DESRM|nr:lipoyl(octanoyl) transferase LipB [Desulforamulus reducens]A4J246.1 RecName: Full=Octanoyltransferase; AltName: Full=Lipoate-protein ligase B; AltName: Full=Lipoyl/octanoyl transferase; AltName: Full=Octanoyl-[acyl-carrier-protein]-protein N-octanoyltransferase [Desulforamulus reducens MI-1]ABO49149.1 lipoate-protein ligase B [Desulforamulus reducens MI-1]